MLQSEKTDQVYGAIMRARLKFGPVVKSKVNPHLGNAYEDLNAVLDAVVESLAVEGCVLTQPTYLHAATSLPCLQSRLTHVASGQWIAAELPLVADRDGPQPLVAASTYMARYTLKRLLALPIEDSDDDGNRAQAAVNRRSSGKGRGGDAYRGDYGTPRPAPSAPRGGGGGSGRPAPKGGPRPPEDGRAFLGWIRRSHEMTGLDVEGFATRWARENGLPDRFLKWDGGEVARGHAAASEWMENQRGDAYEGD